MSRALFKKWRRWLDRIYSEQLSDLLVNQHIFKQMDDCIAPYVGTDQSADLAEWMKQGYTAFAATAVRRMLEEPAKPPKPKPCPHCGELIAKPKPKPEDSLSLVILLRDIEENLGHNPSLFTRSWFRKRYTDKNLPNRLADRDFDKITRSKTADALSASRVHRDIGDLCRIARPVRRLVNKAVAHTSRDRRKIGRPKFKQLNDAIEALADAYRLYSLLVVGSYPTPLVPFGSYDVTDDFKKIWPPPMEGGRSAPIRTH